MNNARRFGEGVVRFVRMICGGLEYAIGFSDGRRWRAGIEFCIKAVVMRAAANGWGVLGFRRCLGLAAAFNPDYDSP